jgi:hypothetical protein
MSFLLIATIALFPFREFGRQWRRSGLTTQRTLTGGSYRG